MCVSGSLHFQQKAAESLLSMNFNTHRPLVKIKITSPEGFRHNLLSLTQFKVAVEPFPVRSGVHPVLMQTGIVIYSFHILTVKCVKGHLRNIIQPLPGSIRTL